MSEARTHIYWLAKYHTGSERLYVENDAATRYEALEVRSLFDPF